MPPRPNYDPQQQQQQQQQQEPPRSSTPDPPPHQPGRHQTLQQPPPTVTPVAARTLLAQHQQQQQQQLQNQNLFGVPAAPAPSPVAAAAAAATPPPQATPATPAVSPALSEGSPWLPGPPAAGGGGGAAAAAAGGRRLEPSLQVTSLHSPEIHPLELTAQPSDAAIRPEKAHAEDTAAIAAATTAAAHGGGGEGGGGGGAVLSRPAVVRLAQTPPTINRLSVVAPAPASPGEGDAAAAAAAAPGSPIAGVAETSPARGLVARLSEAAAGVAAPPPPPQVAAAPGAEGAGHGHGVLVGLRQLAAAVATLAGRVLGPAGEVARARPLAVAMLAAAAVPAAVLVGGLMCVELVLMPLLALPGMAVSFAVSFLVAAAASLSYNRNRAAAARRHAALGLLYAAGTQLPATAPASATAPSGAAAAASGASGAAASTLTLVDDPGLAALRRLVGGGYLPAWLADARHGERAEWVNALLARVWPSVEGPLRDVADLAKPPFIHSVGLADLSLGATPPRIEAVRVRPLASAAAQTEAAVAVATAVAAAAGGAAGGGQGAREEGAFSFDTARPGAPSIAAASVSPAAATEAAAPPAAAASPGVVLSGVADSAMAAVAAAVAVEEHLSGGAAAPAAAAAAAAAAGGGGKAKTPSGSAAASAVNGGGGGLEGIEVEVDFEWRGDPTIGLFVEAYLTPGGNTVRLTPRLRELAAAGTVRLVLTPLVPYPPGFGAIQISMPRAPQLAFSFDLGPSLGTGGGVAGPVAAFLQPLVQDVLAEALVWPERVVVPLLSESLTGPLTALKLQTQGLMAVRLVEARGPPQLQGPEGAEVEGAEVEGVEGVEALKEGAQVEVSFFTRPDRRLTSPPATCHYGTPALPATAAAVAAAIQASAAGCAVCSWGAAADVGGGGAAAGDVSGGDGGGGDGGGGVTPSASSASSWPLFYLPVQEPRSDVMRVQLSEVEGFKLGELLQPNLIRGVRQAWSSRRPLGRAAVPLAPLVSEPGASVTAWLPLQPPHETAAPDDPLSRPSDGGGGGGGGGGALRELLQGPAAGEVHRGKVAGRPQLGEGVGEEGKGGGGGGGGEWAGGFGAVAKQAVWAVPAVAGGPLGAAAGGGAGGGTAATAPVAEPLLQPPPPPPPAARARGGAVLVSMSYLSLDILSERLAAAVTESLRTTGVLPLVRGLLLVDVVSARWLLGPYAYGPGERPPSAAAAAAAEPPYSDSDSDVSDDEEEDGGGGGGADVAAAVDAASRIVASDAPLTFGGDAGGGAGSLHSNPAAARVLGAAAHVVPDTAAAGGLALRDRHGRIRCDPYVQIEVTRPVVTAAAGGPITPGQGGGDAAAGVAPYFQRGSPVPASVDPSFGLHAEVEGIVPAAEGCELRVQVWHRRWFRQPKPLGQVVVPLSRLLMERSGEGQGEGAPAGHPPPSPPSLPPPQQQGGVDGLVSMCCGRLEGWARLSGRGSRGGEVQLRLQFLPYLR
ncbi:hypothetical protein PLESTM_001537200 [Pleodorina starrii]|nr:hypothetical protein PLESTM_001537200 [Pleodorina starrii]